MLTDLTLTPVAEVLRRLSADMRSGDLQVRSGKIVKTLFFDRGRLVFAASNLKKDRLGESLVALGRITDEQFNQATALMKGDHKQRFGEALVASGVMDKDELGKSVARQVKRIATSIFELTDGVGFFEERNCAIPLDYMVSLSLHRLLYVGIKSMSGKELILAGLGNLDRWVHIASVPPFRFGIRKCSAEEREIIEEATKKVTLRRLAWATGGLSLSRMRAVYGLLASGVLVEADAKEGSQPIIQMETSTFLLSALKGKPDPTGRQILRQEVDAELSRSANLDREKWLRVSRTAPQDVLTRALEEKMERYHALLDAVGDDAELKTDIELVLGRASSMLRLARQGDTASDAVAGTGAEAPAAPPVAEVETPSMDPEAPPAEAAEAAEPAPAPSPEPAPGPAVSPTGSMTGQAQIEHLMMEGSVRMTVGDYANAVPVYERLVDLEPNVAAFRLRLAIAMAFYPRTAKGAERQFLEAVRLDPNNADLHYQFGLYYKSMKIRSRAIAEMRTAVSLKPSHKQARAELETLSPKDSALTSLKKLFR
jgi:tetratricopeptide (TPR) repeat protein